ncbi:MAG: hypothetical protein P9L91_10855, partial [Candidatus Zophobacter franzmannii]|nr:hypothetical protein [Candidatus Zophobacter franzmannii]
MSKENTLPISDLEKIFELSKSILGKETGYSHNRKILKKLFGKGEYTFEEVLNQRIALDRMYSTNMNRRAFGEYEIAKGIFKLFGKENVVKKKVLSDRFEAFLENPSNEDDEVYQLLFPDTDDSDNSGYGYQKNGKKLNAISLITKYAYYVTNDNFPIYDSLVLLMQPKFIDKFELQCSNKNQIRNKCKITKHTKSIDPQFFEKMKYTLDKMQEQTGNGNLTYAEMDSVFWLCGKLTNYSISLILEYPKYIDFKDAALKQIDKNKDNFTI